MANDLFGQPIGGYPEIKLTQWQKRQAALLYYWMSLDYLKGLKTMIEALIKGVDVDLDLAQRQGRDALVASARWGVRDTAANWSTNVYPALEEFRQSTVADIAVRVSEEYGKTGANQCARMISEYSSRWMTPEEEEHFKDQFEKVYRYAQFIDFAAGAGGSRTQLNDSSLTSYWQEHVHLIQRLPKLRVRSDVNGSTGKLPKRTGVYISQDDPYATPQFAWIGSSDGILGRAQTLNDVGKRALNVIGRDALWVDGRRCAVFLAPLFKTGELSDRRGFDLGDENDPHWAPTILSANSKTERPCDWYYVEIVEGEYDDEVEPERPAAAPVAAGLRCEAGQPCPRSGYWLSPARRNSRRHFQAGDLMPDLGGDYGLTIWQWAE